MNKLINFSSTSTAFIPFIMAGYPDLEATKQLVIGLEKIGVDAIEIGVPFSDPIGDGPINISAADHALRQGVNLESVLSLIKELRNQNITVPIILFTYFNPILKLGMKKFLTLAKLSGVDSVLVVDLSLDEFPEFYRDCNSNNISNILLASPTTTKDQFDQYNKYNLPFVYYISRLGVTGEQKSLSTTLPEEMKQIRSTVSHPVCVGFGISTPAQADEVAKYADGVIVGSALVKHSHDKARLLSLAESIKKALQRHCS